MPKAHTMLVRCAPVKLNFFLILVKKLEKRKLKFSRSALLHMKTRVSLKYFVIDCLWKPFFGSNWLQTHLKLDFLVISGTLMPFTLF